MKSCAMYHLMMSLIDNDLGGLDEQLALMILHRKLCKQDRTMCQCYHVL